MYLQLATLGRVTLKPSVYRSPKFLPLALPRAKAAGREESRGEVVDVERLVKKNASTRLGNHFPTLSLSFQATCDHASLSQVSLNLALDEAAGD